VTWELRDALTGQNLWSRYFGDEVPTLYVTPQEGKMVLAWKARAKAVHEEAQSNPQVRQRLEGVKLDPFDDFLEVIDAHNGKYLGSVVVDTGKGSFFITGTAAAGGWVAVTDNQNRTLLYSLPSGEAKGRFFGTQPAILSGAGLLALQNERRHLTLYDLSNMESVDEFVFPSALVYKAFAADGKRLFVLTADQTAYTLDLSSETVP
jgi:outer membrane protein assembly factor BamB